MTESTGHKGITMPQTSLDAMSDAELFALKDNICQTLAQRYDELERKLAEVNYGTPSEVNC